MSPPFGTTESPRKVLLIDDSELDRRLVRYRLGVENLELIEAPDRRAEVDAVARRIRGLWREGVRLRDIAVLVRDLELYHELISASFGEHGIEYFVDRRRQVGQLTTKRRAPRCLAPAVRGRPQLRPPTEFLAS